MISLHFRSSKFEFLCHDSLLFCFEKWFWVFHFCTSHNEGSDNDNDNFQSRYKTSEEIYNWQHFYTFLHITPEVNHFKTVFCYFQHMKKMVLEREREKERKDPFRCLQKRLRSMFAKERVSESEWKEKLREGEKGRLMKRGEKR